MLTAPQISATTATLAENLQRLRSRITAAAMESGRTADSVTLLAVTKGHSQAVVRAAFDLGLRDFGESYLQEALPKLTELSDLPLCWHFIGRLQANKTRAIASHFAWVHGLDREKLAQRLAAQRPAHLAPLNVCIEVSVAAEPDKGGVPPPQVPALAQAIAALPMLRLRGLMCILPADLEPRENRRLFGGMRTLLESLRSRHPGLDTLSMGMSADYAEAVLEGATMVRVGTALFGARGLA